MSAVSSRPPVPRPVVRKTPVPPAAIEIPETHESAPPVIRDRMPTLELADDDLLIEAEVAPISRPRSTPPPPPRMRSTVVPKLAQMPITNFDDLAMPEASWDAPALVPAPAPLHHLELIPASRVERVEPKRIAAVTPIAAAVAEPSRARLESLTDPTDVLFEGMYALEFVDSKWQAASICASALARALGARAVVVHSHDLESRELRAIGVHGDRTADLLGSSDDSDDDLVASAVICNEKAVTMRFDGELPRLAPRRLEILGAPRTLVAVPAMAWGRCVAVIEILDADERFAGRVADSAAYVAERLAAYLSGRLAA